MRIGNIYKLLSRSGSSQPCNWEYFEVPKKCLEFQKKLFKPNIIFWDPGNLLEPPETVKTSKTDFEEEEKRRKSFKIQEKLVRPRKDFWNLI